AFQALAPELDAMMVGHANYPALDESGLPASLSRKIVQGILREEWGYQGAVISDDLDMGAIVGHYGLGESVTRAVEAGNDLVLLCHRPELIPEAAKALSTISPARAEEVEKQIIHLREKLDPPHAFSVEAHAAIDRKIYQLRVDTLGAEAAAQRSVDDGKRSPVETF
ncbi:MAG TPA: glycoside hydrolase family 3 N-terminal domain-containing protein, partial [Candidatus Methylacidiphilales bacterium]